MNSPRRRKLAALFTILAPAALVATGCAMCCGPYDYHYPAFGGRIQRADPVYGRVGSVFSDPNMAGVGPLADSNLEDPQSVEDPLPGELPAPRDPSPSPASEDVINRETMNQWRPTPIRGPIGYR